MSNKKLIVIALFILMGTIIAGLLIIDNTTEGRTEVKALVMEVDNSDMISNNISSIGNQVLTIKILEGKYNGRVINAFNTLLGQMELDNIYKPGDKILVALQIQNNKVVSARAIDLYRQKWEFSLFAIFVILLIFYAGLTGLKAIFSFLASLYIIWRLLLPGLLAGFNPISFSALIIFLLSGVIIFSIAGFTKKGVAAFVGTVTGLIFSIGITSFFGNKLGLTGMSLPYAQALLISGNINLNIKDIFYSAIVIGASGAAMDIAMDIAASMAEIKDKKPDIGFVELVKSGFNVGRAVIGTMTTTLLLAYSGGYLTLLMLFINKNSSFVRIVNLKLVAAEILRTVTGSIGLVLVAPITALIAGWIYSVKFDVSPISRIIEDHRIKI